MGKPNHSILLLAGTGEARTIASRLAARRDLRVISSLAGRTATPALPDGEMRTGGFGGAAGLADYISANDIHAVIDATHPFATGMSANAIEACRVSDVPLIRYERPPWSREPGDLWDTVPDEAGATTTIEGGAVVFLALGSQHIGAFAHLTNASFVTRTVDEPDTLPGTNWTAVVGKPGLLVEDEVALFRDHGISRIISRNSGGDAGYAKIHAARILGLPVTMISRPEPISGLSFDSEPGNSWASNIVGFDSVDKIVRHLEDLLSKC